MKYIALRNLESTVAASQEAAVAEIAPRAIRACLLVLDGFTLRLTIAASKRAHNFTTECALIEDAARFDWIAEHVSETASAEEVSLLEKRAVVSAAAALPGLLKTLDAKTRFAPLALCSLVGALYTLRESRASNDALRESPRRNDALRDIENELHQITAALAPQYAQMLALYVFPQMYTSTLQKYVDRAYPI